MKKNDKQTIREEAMAKLLECSFRKDTPLMMKNDNGVFALFFDTRVKGLSEFKYKRLWYVINQVVRNDEKNWMYRYWEFADQYYSNTFAYESSCEEGKRFFEFHVAVGGLFALNKKYEWIEHIASFSNCLPAKYFLIPSTFSEIFNWLQYFDDMVGSSIDLDIKYHLYSQYEGVRAGANLYKGIVEYLALMMCRLPEMDFNSRYVDPMALPRVYGCASNEKKNFVSVNLENIRIAESADQLEEYDFLEGRSYNNINRESVMVRHIIAGAIFRYTKILNTYQASATLNVRYRDISSALTKLSIPMGYVVLVGSIGTHLLPDGFDNNPDVHFIYSKQSEIIIVNKSLLPFVSFDEEKCNGNKYKLIDDKKNKILYSNIWQIQEAGETKLNAEKNKYFDLFIGCYASIYMPPKEKRKCIRIRAIDGITQETFDLDKILKITDYMA